MPDYISGTSQLRDNILNRQPENTNPLVVTEYKFTMQRISTVTYFCQSANVPGINVGEVSQPTYFAPAKRPGDFTFDDFTITFVVGEELKNWLEIYNWMRSTTNAEDFSEYEGPDQHFSDASLMITNSAMRGKILVNFKELFPKNLSSIDFTSTSSDADPIIATCTFAYSSYDIERLDS